MSARLSPGRVLRSRRPGRRPPLPGPVRLLLASQLAFNTGFYLVVPFLAVHLGTDLAMAGWVVGLVLGVRTFSQQGLFFLGGALTDRYGVRPVLLTGCVVRIAGLVTLGSVGTLPGVLVGTVLTGFAAALFSPATETALSHAGRRLEAEGGRTRAELFALDDVVGKVGSLLGPVLGAALLEASFALTCYVAAAVFAVVAAANARWAPREHAVPRSTSITEGWSAVLANPRFLLFTGLHSTSLLAYNQMYLALPAELRRATGSESSLGAMFVVAAVVTVTTQVPLTRWARRLGTSTALLVGFLGTGAAFALVAVACLVPLPPRWPALVPAVAFVVVLHLASAVARPVARDLVPGFAGERAVGAHFGVLASGGGLAVLVGSAAVGAVLEPGAATPWVAMAVLSGASAVGLAVLARRTARVGPPAGPPVSPPVAPGAGTRR